MSSSIAAKEALEDSHVGELSRLMDSTMSDEQHDAALFKVFKSDTKNTVLYVLTPAIDPSTGEEAQDLVPRFFYGDASDAQKQRAKGNPSLVAAMDNARDRKLYGVELRALDMEEDEEDEDEEQEQEHQEWAVDMALMRMVDCTTLQPKLVIDSEGRGELRATVDGVLVRLDYAFAHMRPSPVPTVSMVDVLHIYGTDLETGESRTQIIVPPSTAFASAIGMFFAA